MVNRTVLVSLKIGHQKLEIIIKDFWLVKFNRWTGWWIGLTDADCALSLQRHFAVFNLPTPQDDALKSIVHGILDVSFHLEVVASKQNLLGRNASNKYKRYPI